MASPPGSASLTTPGLVRKYIFGFQFPLKHVIAAIVVAAMVLLGLTVVVLGQISARQTVLMTTAERLQDAGRLINEQTGRMLEPARATLLQMSFDPLTSAPDLATRLQRAFVLIEPLAANQLLSSLYIGYGNGDFLLARRLDNAAVRALVDAPVGATFLMPNDPQSNLIMVCTGTGSAPFRGFTMRRQRTMPNVDHAMKLFFGARTPDSLPYFGPLKKVPDTFLGKYFAFSRVSGQPKEYVQDQLRLHGQEIAQLMLDQQTYIYICGLKAMEHGVEAAFADIARGAGMDWAAIRQSMREQGRYHVETY